MARIGLAIAINFTIFIQSTQLARRVHAGVTTIDATFPGVHDTVHAQIVRGWFNANVGGRGTTQPTVAIRTVVARWQRIVTATALLPCLAAYRTGTTAVDARFVPVEHTVETTDARAVAPQRHGGMARRGFVGTDGQIGGDVFVVKNGVSGFLRRNWDGGRDRNGSNTGKDQQKTNEHPNANVFPMRDRMGVFRFDVVGDFDGHVNAKQQQQKQTTP